MTAPGADPSVDPGLGRAGSGFLYHATEAFREKLRRVGKADPAGHRRIQQTIARLLADPTDSDGRMRGLHRGKLKKYAGRAGYRLIYNWCEGCRKANEHLREACPGCGTIPDHSVVFLDLFHKSDHLKLGY